MPISAENSESVARSLAERFDRAFRAQPKIFRAPGRVNLIGEHTDYNDGFVMPMAINFCTWVAASERTDRILCVRSEQFDGAVELHIDDLAGHERKSVPHWSDFVCGVAAVLQKGGYKISGANLLIDGQVPIGAGLSSSASLEVATALALLAVSRCDVPRLDSAKMELAKICQRAEHEYVGTRCGIMDQFIAIFGRSGHALKLDCRSLSYDALAIPDDVSLMVCNSMVRHELAAGEYNRRRADCEDAVRIVSKRKPHVTALRDMTLADLESFRGELSEPVFRRCRHVMSENRRVLDAAEALRSGNMNRFGELMYESHRSLRDDYEVSCRELDLLVEIASRCEGVYGARMTGGGFGGCIIALVSAGEVESFRDRIAEKYRSETGITPDVYVCSAARGAEAWAGNLLH